MTLAAGTRLGAYDIVALIGAGGMGEVYRARDTRLKREVAIKVLPDAFANDTERLARFQREAELLATLNHPNIAQIHGFEDRALVLELVDGPTLADRIAQGPMPVDEAIRVATQIVEALEAAHERGVIHRDLKPANIKLTADDTVKVLDFGLAKAMESNVVAPGSSLSHSPTLSMMATQAGMVLGTAAYMSPEQAKGFPTDQRSDIFAFGIVVYEMLTGRKPFDGDTAADVLASVIVRDADLTALAANINPRLRELIGRCLQKNPKRRWQAIGDLRAELEVIAASPYLAAATPVRSVWRPVAALLAAIIVSATATGFMTYLAVRPASAPLIKFVIPLNEDQFFITNARQLLAVSPDGTQLVYTANQSLYLRSLGELETREISGTTAGQGFPQNPVFSPDGRWIAFWNNADRLLRKVAVAGGPAMTLGRIEAPFGMTWSATGILYGHAGVGVMRIPSSGGNPETLIATAGDETAQSPQMLPGDRAVLFTLAKGVRSDRWDSAEIVVHSLDSGSRQVLVKGGTDGRYLPSGHLIYVSGRTIFALPLDVRRFRAGAEPVPVIEAVRRTSSNNAAHASVSDTGVLTYVPAAAGTGNTWSLALLDRQGQIEALQLTPGPYELVRVSPDGQYVALVTNSSHETVVWIYNVSGQAALRRLTFGGRNNYPIWSRDGQRIIFQSDREGDSGIFWQRADGTGSAQRLTRPPAKIEHIPDSYSSSADVLLFSALSDSQYTVHTLSIPDQKVAPFGGVISKQPITPVFSPDGQWVAYTSTETGEPEVFVQPFPATGLKYQISRKGGHHPLWSPDGRELIYDVTAGLSEVVSISQEPTFTVGHARVLPRGSMLFAGYQTMRPVDMRFDGRILGRIENEQQRGVATQQIRVVLNWFEELKGRVPATN